MKLEINMKINEQITCFKIILTVLQKNLKYPTHVYTGLWIFYVLEMWALIRKNLRRDFCIPKKQVMENLLKGDNKAKYRVFLAYLDIFAHKSVIWKSCLRNHFEFELVSQRAIGHRQFKRPCKQTLIYIYEKRYLSSMNKCEYVSGERYFQGLGRELLGTKKPCPKIYEWYWSPWICV